MAETVLQVDHLSKKFHIKRNSLGKQAQGDESDEFYAIRNLSFDIRRGEICGLIGRNGAGKTTLLELLSGIIKPSEGEISIYGRTASVIDIGTGMHRDLSGLENIYLSGEILGMTRMEIEEKLPDILAFSELGNFIYLPVKHYSSGMFMRLAFSVITHLHADIMLIDEIIGVGDLTFSEKTTNRIIDICKQGRSAIIATHSLALVKACCQTAIYLKNGVMVKKDTVDKVEELYLEDVLENKSLLPKGSSTDTAPQPFKLKLECHPDESKEDASKKLRLIRASLKSSGRHENEEFSVRDELGFELVIESLVEQSFILSVHINHQYNRPAFCLTPELSQTALPGAGRIRLCTSIPSNLLNQGLYTVSVFFADHDNNLINSYEGILIFKVNIDDHSRDAFGYSGKFSGPAFIGGHWNTEKV